MSDDTTTNYQRARQQLITKTKRRRQHFDGDNREHRNARNMRRACGGAFGRLLDQDYPTYKVMVVGTSRGAAN